MLIWQFYLFSVRLTLLKKIKYIFKIMTVMNYLIGTDLDVTSKKMHKQSGI